MTETAKSLFSQAMQLTEQERLELARNLLDAVVSDVETSWTAALRERLAEFDAGNAELVEWSDARTELHRQ